MGEKIQRLVIEERYEEVEVPEGHIVCYSCKGKGSSSKYDEGWNSLVHSPELAARRSCTFCQGLGHVPDYR